MLIRMHCKIFESENFSLTKVLTKQIEISVKLLLVSKLASRKIMINMAL